MRSDQVAQGYVQSGPEIPQGPRLYNLSWQPEPLPDCPNGEFPSPSIPVSVCGHCLSAVRLPPYLFSKVLNISCQVPEAVPSRGWTSLDTSVSPHWPSPGFVLPDCPCSHPGARTGCHILGALSWTPGREENCCCPWSAACEAAGTARDAAGLPGCQGGFVWCPGQCSPPPWSPSQQCCSPARQPPVDTEASGCSSECSSLVQKQALELSEDHFFKKLRAPESFQSTRNLWPNNCDEFFPAVFPLLGNRQVVMALLLNTCAPTMISMGDWDTQQGFLRHTVFLESY